MYLPYKTINFFFMEQQMFSEYEYVLQSCPLMHIPLSCYLISLLIKYGYVSQTIVLCDQHNIIYS